ncbi:MAG TPA: hypothetical protein VLL77_01105 [Anaerolineales bacterium]|nr:hypothetical protein [Anaerolineales bacterium]
MSAASAASSEERILAFLDLATFDEGAALRGGCLVTDGLTRPLEFRVSGPIRPTSLQKVLYGDTLQEYICTDLVGLPMLQDLESKPEIILVRDAEFLKLRPRVEIPVLWVRGTVEGQFVLQAFPGYEQEAEAGRDSLPRRLRGRSIMEPFQRIHSALEEAHNQKVGESKKA